MKLSFELRWGLFIGLVNLAWLYVSFWIGMHRTLVGSQVVMLIGTFFSVSAYVFAMRSLLLKYPESSFLEGMKAAASIAGISAVIAVLSRVGYHFALNPGWTDFMVGETERYYLAQDVPKEKAAELAETSRKTFGFVSYAIQAALGAIVIGIVVSAISIFSMKRKAK